MTKRPDAEFIGQSWDKDGKPIPGDRSPGMVYELPLLPLLPDENLPPGISAHLLDGNWYGSGPEIVLWDGISEMHLSIPMWERKRLAAALHRLQKAAKIKKENPARVKIHGGVWVTGI